jgi:hypothetical protein
MGFLYIPQSAGPATYGVPSGLRGLGGGTFNFDFSAGVLPSGITFTRASIGTYTNSTGTLITAGNDVARFNYVSGVACLLIEPAQTNLLTQSNNFSTAPWVAVSGAVITPAQFTSPDGTTNGWTITSGTGNGGCSYPVTFLNIAYTMSIWAKRQAGAAPIDFILAGTDSGPLATSATLSRLSFSTTTPSGPSFATFYTNAITGNTSGFYGAQLETGSAVTSYIPTSGATVTRAADSAVFTIPAGIGHLTFTLDDNSTQTVVVSPGSYTIPTSLARPNIKSIVGSV